MPNTPLVNAVIAVHDASRPVARAVRSLTESGLRTGDELRITVVCHNLGVDAISSAMPPALAEMVRFLELADGIASAAGPFNAGVDAATGRYVSIMGSDDYLQPGALASWLRHSGDGSADAVIAPELHADGSRIRTPPIRRFRRAELDPLKDRLAYRTAPLGLIRRTAIDRLGLRFPDGLRSGEDQNFSAKLWFGGGIVRMATGSPGYVVGADATTRISMTSRPMRLDFAFVDQLLGDPWFARSSDRVRRALAVKVVRIHLFAAVLARIGSGQWTADDQEYVSSLVGRLRAGAAGFERSLSIADCATIDAIADVRSDADRIAALAQARRRFGRPSTVVTRDARGLFAVDGPIRFMVASALV